MHKPTQCAIWKDPELVRGPMNERFELLETFFKESHHWRYLLKCRECGQIYFYEFYEEIDWEHGDDPQWCTYIPLATVEGAEPLKMADRLELLQQVPRLQKDYPKEARTSTLYWVGK